MPLIEEPIDIVMATYNGEKFIRAQIESILNQTYQNLRLIIGDDCSTDKTVEIVTELLASYPEKITLIVYKNNVGARDNFSRLLDEVDAQYIMFADQDDVWLPEKVALSYAKMKELEELYDSTTPILIHTDLTVVNDNLEVIDTSCWRYLGLSTPPKFTLNRLLVRHASIGCTQMFNQALLILATPIPKEAGMHDYWMSLVALTFGRVGTVNTPTMLYRQHADNVIGTVHPTAKWLYKSLKKDTFPIQMQTRILRCLARAFVFYRRYQQLLPEKDKATLRAFTTLKHHTFLGELGLRIKYGFWEPNLWQNLALFIGSYKMGRITGPQSFEP